MNSSKIELNRANLFSAIERSLAVIVFDTQGNIVWANDHFAHVIGYGVNELKQMHHRQLCLDTFSNSYEYTAFWDELRNNRAYHNKVERVSKDGTVLWLDATYTPVVDELGRVENVVKIANDVTNQENILRNSSAEFIALVEQMTASTNEVHYASQRAVENMEKLQAESDTVNENVKQIESMANAVKNIASQSHILGLNASIEAARAGEHGRGFAVVANEVQKMANGSKSSAESIESQLNQIAGSVDQMAEMVKQMTEHINHNSSSIGELKEAYTHITKMAEQLSSLVQ